MRDAPSHVWFRVFACLVHEFDFGSASALARTSRAAAWHWHAFCLRTLVPEIAAAFRGIALRSLAAANALPPSLAAADASASRAIATTIEYGVPMMLGEAALLDAHGFDARAWHAVRRRAPPARGVARRLVGGASYVRRPLLLAASTLAKAPSQRRRFSALRRAAIAEPLERALGSTRPIADDAALANALDAVRRDTTRMSSVALGRALATAPEWTAVRAAFVSLASALFATTRRAPMCERYATLVRRVHWLNVECAPAVPRAVPGVAEYARAARQYAALERYFDGRAAADDGRDSLSSIGTLAHDRSRSFFCTAAERRALDAAAWRAPFALKSGAHRPLTVVRCARALVIECASLGVVGVIERRALDGSYQVAWLDSAFTLLDDVGTVRCVALRALRQWCQASTTTTNEHTLSCG